MSLANEIKMRLRVFNERALIHWEIVCLFVPYFVVLLNPIGLDLLDCERN